MRRLKAATLRGALSTFCSFILLTTAYARADEPSMRLFDIGPQSLATALNEFARQSQQEILFAPEVVAQKLSSGVRGTMQPLAALKLLLNDSALTFTTTANGAVLVGAPPSGATTPPPSSEENIAPKATGEDAVKKNPGAVGARRGGIDDRIRVAEVDQGKYSNDSSAGKQVSAEKAANLEEIIVTARRREERLQDVPDSVTALTADTIEQANVRSLTDFTRLIPNVTLQNDKSFSSGDFHLSLRGIGNGQLGWPSVAFLIDGIPSDSLDNIADENYHDLERIEVLRGPQSAVYGFNAIAGAINIITRPPADRLEGNVYAEYANGQDKRVGGTISGPLSNSVSFRLFSEVRDFDGVIGSDNRARPLDFAREYRTRARLVFKPTDQLTLDLRGDYNNTKNGAVYQPLINALSEANDFSPQFEPTRRLVGIEPRKFYRVSLRGQYDLDASQLISVTSYSNSKQNIESSLCYENPDHPQQSNLTGKVICPLGGQAFGSSAQPGQLVDQGYLALDNSKSVYEDVRLQSSGNTPFKWMFGGSYMWRDAVDGGDYLNIFAGPGGGAGCADGRGFDPSGCGPSPIFFANWNERRDNWRGAYGQASYSFTPQLELTLAGRYDNQIYENTQFTSRHLTTVVPVPNLNGDLERSQRETKQSFQPKVQLSYKFTPDLMAYFTYARGFRAGYFNTGAFAKPEQTDNYEVGTKTSFNLGSSRLIVNGAMFRIDYSNQQSSTVIGTPPFRFPVTIPQTTINGAELETSLALRDGLGFSGALGYLDSKIKGGQQSPLSPKLTINLGVDYKTALSNQLNLTFHADYRRHSRFLLGPELPSQDVDVPPKDYVNIRTGLDFGEWEVAGFVQNLLNKQEVTSPVLVPYYIRAMTDPRRYGVQVRYSF